MAVTKVITLWKREGRRGWFLNFSFIRLAKGFSDVAISMLLFEENSDILSEVLPAISRLTTASDADQFNNIEDTFSIATYFEIHVSLMLMKSNYLKNELKNF